jgi:hypothetical protein
VEVVVALGIVVALAAAVRSTWSPCGQSMLSQIAPFTERARGQRYRVTAVFFVVGSVVGGATLGVAVALGAAVLAAVDVSPDAALAVAAVAALLAAAVDAGTLGARPPFFRRQVNEDWLPRYRGWLYGAGFGWQVGVGVATYIMTAAVFLTAALAMLTADPVAAFLIAVAFGLVRGLTVFLTARAQTPAQLQSFHRRFDAWGEPVRRAVIGVQVIAAIVAAAALAGGAGALVTAAVVAVVAGLSLVSRRASGQRRAQESTARAHA